MSDTGIESVQERLGTALSRLEKASEAAIATLAAERKNAAEQAQSAQKGDAALVEVEEALAAAELENEELTKENKALATLVEQVENRLNAAIDAVEAVLDGAEESADDGANDDGSDAADQGEEEDQSALFEESA